jgi:hypothetical protein
LAGERFALLQRDMRFRMLLLCFVFSGGLFTTACFAQIASAPDSQQAPAATQGLTQGPAYSLPPAKLQRAEALNRDENWLWAIGTVWSLVYPLLFLRLHWAAGLRRFAARIASRPWV